MDISRAEIAAYDLIKELDIRKYPIDVDVIASYKGIDIIYDDMEGGASGFIFKEGDFIVIGVNSNHNTKRQRFTIAHELGHNELHLSSSNTAFIDENSTSAYLARDKESGWGVNSQEIEANAFAAALLMPEQFVRDAVERYKQKFSSIEDIAWRMAKDFNVSEQAMTIRLVKLSIFDIGESKII